MKHLLDKLKGVISEVREELAPIVSRREQLDMSEVTELFMILRDLVECGESVTSIANVALPDVSERCRLCIEASGFDEVSKEYNGTKYRLTPDVKLHASVNKANEPEFIIWMKDNPYGRELVKESVNPSSLKAFITRELEAGRELTPLITAFPQATLKVRKIK